MIPFIIHNSTVNKLSFVRLASWWNFLYCSQEVFYKLGFPQAVRVWQSNQLKKFLNLFTKIINHAFFFLLFTHLLPEWLICDFSIQLWQGSAPSAPCVRSSFYKLMFRSPQLSDKWLINSLSLYLKSPWILLKNWFRILWWQIMSY